MKLKLLTLVTLLIITLSAWAQKNIYKVNTVDGLDIAIQEWGNPKGKEIVFIHGLGQSYLSWAKQTNSEILKDFRIITYDLRGHGNSDKPNVSAIYADGKRWGEELDSVIKKAKLKKPTLIGWSLGGFVIANYLNIYGDKKVSGIVLVDPVVKFAPEYFGKDSGPMMSGLADEDLKFRSLAIVNFLRACFKIPPTKEEFEVMLAFNAMVPKVVHIGMNNLTVLPSDKVLSSLKAPTLIIQGQHDQLVSMAMAKYAKDTITNSSLMIFEKSGHAPFFEEDEKFNIAVKEFVGKLK